MDQVDPPVTDKRREGEPGTKVLEEQPRKKESRHHGRCIPKHHGLDPQRLQSTGKTSGPGEQEQGLDLSVKKPGKMEKGELPTAEVGIQIEIEDVQWRRRVKFEIRISKS